jgi:membrane protein DedA with SNARE-associated domain
MNFQHEPVFQWLASYAYEPQMVYMAIIGFMIASGFGLPIPEEVTIVSAGILAYMGAHPELFPPPYPGAPVVHGYETAVVTLCAVIFADLLVFNIGRRFGRKIMGMPRFHRYFAPERTKLINSWVKKYGVYAAFIFRFTPGIRFPAHVFLGMSELASWRFLLVDGIAALISVPTQILLIYHFGEPILSSIQKFKLWIIAVIGAVILIFILRKFIFPKFRQRPSGG